MSRVSRVSIWAVAGGAIAVVVMNAVGTRADAAWTDPEFTFVKLAVLNVAFAIGLVAGGVAGYFRR